MKQRVVSGIVEIPKEDYLALEDPLEITLHYHNGEEDITKKFVVTMRTPGNDDELIHGFLFSEGIIKKATEIISIRLDRDEQAQATKAQVSLQNGINLSQLNKERNFAAHSSCGVCGTTSVGHLNIPNSLNFKDLVEVSSSWIHNLPDLMYQKQETFHQTGGLHASAIFSEKGNLLVSREDIGRHNALDKAIGVCLIENHIPNTSKVLCVSGRMSYEILQKAIIARIPIIAGVGAPSSLAVNLANAFNITLIGFVRDDSYNIYSCPERLN